MDFVSTHCFPTATTIDAVTLFILPTKFSAHFAGTESGIVGLLFTAMLL